MIFSKGDIVLAKKNLFSKFYNTYNTFDIIGRVLNYDIETCKITFDIVIIDSLSNIKTGVIEMLDFGFQLAEPKIAKDFNNYINNIDSLPKSTDQVFIKFIDLFDKADIETKYKIIEYILASNLNN